MSPFSPFFFFNFILLICSLLFTYHPFHYFLGFSLTFTPFPTIASKKFQLDIKSSAHQGAQLHSSLIDIYALWQSIKGFSPDHGLRALLHKLLEFIKCSNGRQPAVIIHGRSVAWVLAKRAHFRGSQALRSPISQTRLSWAYLRQFGRHCLPRPSRTQSCGGSNPRRS